MKRLVLVSALTIALLFCAQRAFGWGESNRVAIVNTAARLVSKNGNVPLATFTKEVEQGASISAEEFEERYPSFDKNAANVISNQMLLLEAIRPARLDAYYAFRLGELGALTARAAAPLLDAPENYRRMYDADVTQAIASIPLAGSTRRLVDPDVYFPEIRRALRGREDLILKDYQEGAGFSGLAKASLSDDVSRAVAAVADVWYTIIGTAVSPATVSDAKIHEFILGSVGFYLDRNQVSDAYRHFERLLELTRATPDLRKAVADKFFEANAYDQAIDEYKKVLGEVPNRRDVTQRLAEYNMRMGERSLEAGAYEAALDSFNAALDVDRLYPDAQKRVLETEALIAEREARLAAVRQAIAQGRDLIDQADRFLLERDFGLANARLTEATGVLASVSEEFPEEAREAGVALREIQIRQRDLRSQLINNAQTLSGAGAALSAQRLAASAPRFGEEALMTMENNEFQRQINALRESIGR